MGTLLSHFFIETLGETLRNFRNSSVHVLDPVQKSRKLILIFYHYLIDKLCMRSRLIFCGLKWLQANLHHLDMVIPQRHDTINVWGKSWIPKKNICRDLYTHGTSGQSHDNPPGIGICARNIFWFLRRCLPVDPTFSLRQDRHQSWSMVWHQLCHEGECHGASEAYCTVADGPYISIQRISEVCHRSKGTIHWGFPYCYYQ